MSPTVDGVYDTVARDYDRFYSSARYREEDRRLAGILRAALVLGRVLDLGCGTGYLLDLGIGLEVRTWDYLGVDLSSGMLRQAREKHPYHRFRKMDIQRLPASWAGRFDNVVSLFEPLNMVPAPEVAIAEAVRVLRPGGRAVLMFATPRHTQSDILKALDVPLFLNPFTAREAAAVLNGVTVGPVVKRFSPSYDLLFAGRA